MNSKQQPALALELRHVNPPGRLRAKIEALRGAAGQPLLESATVVQRLSSPVDGSFIEHSLERFACPRHEDRAQNLVLQRKFGKCLAQSIQLNIGLQAIHGYDVVHTRRCLELLQKPQPLLDRRHRESVPIGRNGNLLASLTDLTIDELCMPCNRGGAKQIRKPELTLERKLHASRQPREQQRMTANLEEVVVSRDRVHAQQLAPDYRDALLVRRPWRPALAAAGDVPAKLRQTPVVDLAVRRQWQGIDGHEVLRDHVPRQPLAEVVAQLHGIDGLLLRWNHERHQPVIAAGGRALGHGDRPDPRRAQQVTLDITGLDAETAHLELGVDPAMEAQLTVRGQRDQVASLEPATLVRLRQVEIDESSRREFRVVQVAAAHAPPTDIEFSDNVKRHVAIRRVEYPELRIRNRSADLHGIAVSYPGARRPERRLGRAIKVPQARYARKQRFGQLRAHRLASAERLETGSPGPPRLQEHGPGRGGCLHQRCTRSFEEFRKFFAVVHGLGLGNDRCTPADQR